MPLLWFLLLLLLGLAGCARDQVAARNAAVVPAQPAAAPAAPGTATTTVAAPVEPVRSRCIEGRRLICGRVLALLPEGLVVDSGYTDLLRPPLIQNWVIPHTVPASRNPTALELQEPGTPCIGLCFLTDIPKRPKVKPYDYVVLMGYPAGTRKYTSVLNVERTLRQFAAGLDTAVRLTLQAQKSPP